MEKITVGENIKRYREQLGITQKTLAESLNVTYQAVSRWENNSAEPDISTLKELATIFAISLDTLLSNVDSNKMPEEKEALVVADEPKETSNAKPVEMHVGSCTSCGNAVYEKEVYSKYPKLICKTCHQSMVDKADHKKKIVQSGIGDKRRKAFWIAGIITGIIWLIYAITISTSGLPFLKILSAVFGGFLLSYFLFSPIFVLVINNTFINDMMAGILDWGFVRMPGIIFTLDFDGLIFLIATKILLGVIGIFIAFLFGLLAVALGLPACWLAFPFSLLKSVREEKNTRDEVPFEKENDL